MRQVLTFAAAGLAVAAIEAAPAGAQAVDLNIMTGGPAGTYIQMGRDIAEVAASCGRNLIVNESAGSLENAMAVRDRPMTQFGIVQSDVLEYLRTFAEEDPEYRRIADDLRIVLPLHDEEVHILATREIEGLSDLEGRRVSVGVPASGTNITASLVLDLAGVDPGERVDDLPPSEALDALLAGEVDAMFYTVGVPAPLFAEAEIDGDAFHLLPLQDAVLRAVYDPATIDADAYPFMTEAVESVAVKAVLMTFEFDRRRSAYHRRSCQNVSDITHLLITRFDELRGNGHPKWQEVDVAAIPPGWAAASCALDGVDPTFAFTCIAEDGTETVEQAAPAVPQANALFLRRICERIDC